jgi:hypothetical protein
MKIEAFYHICAKGGNGPLSIIDEQLKTIRNSEIYDILDKINCCLVGDDRNNFIYLFQNISKYGDKFKISKTGWNDNTYERFTLNYMKEKIIEDGIYLYIHSKGVTKWNNENIKDWRKCMEYFLIKNGKKCIDKIQNEQYDTVGIMKHPFFKYPHYSGNFWWASGSYLMKLFKEKQIMNEYIGPEMYLLSNNPKSFDFFPIHHMNKDYDGYWQRLPKELYINYLQS